MKNIKIHPSNKKIKYIFDNIASDKSISHRSIIFALLSDKKSYIKNFLQAKDTISTLNIAKQLGAKIIENDKEIEIIPPDKIIEPSSILDCGNSGTGMRLYTGFLSGFDGSFVLSGDKYLNNRPMKRVTEPLRNIGVKIDGRKSGILAPLFIRGGSLESFKYHSDISSAQVKSALILSALQNRNSKSYYKENTLSRDHTERMLRGMGAEINESKDGWIEIVGLKKPLNPLNIIIPSDPSSAFFFAVAASIIPNSEIIIKNITLNPTRIEAYQILKKMGAIVLFIQKENIYEPVGDIVVKYNGRLKSITIEKNISWLIDELPALSIALSFANGKSLVKNANELRVKESDRISTVLEGLGKCGIKTVEYPDGYEIVGQENINIKFIKINSYGDHRVAMSFAILGLLVDVEIEDIECVDTSFPDFFKILHSIN